MLWVADRGGEANDCVALSVNSNAVHAIVIKQANTANALRSPFEKYNKSRQFIVVLDV